MGDRSTVLILMIVLVFLLIQIPMAYSAELTVAEKALAFLEDAVMRARAFPSWRQPVSMQVAVVAIAFVNRNSLHKQNRGRADK